MKILHTSDLHLGIELHGVSMLNEQQHFINSLESIIKDNNIKAVLLSGDVYDNSVSTVGAINLYNTLAEIVCVKLNIPMFVIAGNHDGAARLSSLKTLLQKSQLYVTGKLTKDITPVISGDVAIYSIPYFNIDEVRALFPDEKIKTYQDAFLTVCNNIAIDKSKVNIVLAHAYVSGATLTDSDTSAMIGTSSMISAEVFQKFHYVALGHLHKPQTVAKNCRYSGTPIKYSFSEANHKKSVTVYDTDAKTIEEIYLTPLNDMEILKGGYDEIINKSSNSYLKIEITDKHIGLEMLEVLKSIFPNLLSVTGKSEEASREITITAEEIKTMSPTEILESFFKEIYGQDVTENQVEIFCDALSRFKEGDDKE